MLRHAAVTTAAVPFVAFAWLLAGCPASQVDICYGDACGAVEEAGADAHQTLPTGCKDGDDPTQNLACVDESIGLFVSQGGADTNPGTKDRPLQHLSTALTKTDAQHNRLFVCAGLYEEGSLTLTKAVSIYGGYACEDWTYAGVKAAPHVTTQQTTGATLTIEKVDGAVTIEGVALDGPTPAHDGESSLAALVVGSGNVTFTSVTLTAHAAKGGKAGAMTPVTFPVQTAMNGKAAAVGTGGMAVSITCPAGGTTVGGAGGASGAKGDDGLPALGGGKGGTINMCNSGGGGANGTGASAAKKGDAATVVGMLDESGWSPTAGGDGVPGAPGQGGGGGAGIGTGSFGGGGGGAGGCGGAQGAGGGGGGASIAIASFGSNVKLTGCTLVVGDGGAGGAGAAGQPGQTSVGLSGSSAGACPGGTGGPGGSGGAGGGGAGGVSVGILSKGGAAPTTDVATDHAITVGKPGAKGAGGDANDGVAGTAAPKLVLP